MLIFSLLCLKTSYYYIYLRVSGNPLHLQWRKAANKLTTLDNDIIHVEMIDGTTCWVPSKAKLVGDNRYLILENEYFDENDTSMLLQFIPGDTVTVVEHVFSENKKGLFAKTLLQSSSSPRKRLFEFLFNATKQTLPIDSETVNTYSQEIHLVKERLLVGESFYPSIVDTIQKLDRV